MRMSVHFQVSLAMLSLHLQRCSSISSNPSDLSNSYSEATTVNESDTSADIDGGQNSSDFSYALPQVSVQFICHDENILQSGFSVVQVFDGFYRSILPTMSHSTLSHDLQTTSMSEIPKNKWYYSNCNISTPQVLLTMETEGRAHLQAPYSELGFEYSIMDAVNASSLEGYFKANVCSDMEIFRAVVVSATDSYQGSSSGNIDHNQYLDHSPILLCGGERYIYNDADEDLDSGFFLFAMMVGMVMVSMIIGELQPLYARRRPTTATTTSETEMAETTPVSQPESETGTSALSATTSSTTAPSRQSSRRNRRRSRRRRRQRQEYALTPTEVEMV